MATIEYQYQLYEQLAQRSQLAKEDQKTYEALAQGRLGERTIGSFLHQWQDDSWQILSNLELVIQNQRIQIDFALIIGHTVYLIEVKHYSSDLIYRKSRWYYTSGQEYAYDILGQMRRAHHLVARYLGINANVQSVLVFSHENMHLEVETPIDDVTVLMRHQLYKYLLNLPSYKAEYWIEQQLLAAVKPYQLLWTSHLSNCAGQAQTGILCPQCQSAYSTMSHQQFHCPNCQRSEYKSAALIRTIWQWCILHPDQPVSANKIIQFCDQPVSTQTLYNAIHKVCPRTNISGRRRYLNPCRECIRLEL